ncbi:PilZ domain-containing protein [Pseudomonas sp. R5(2019)]|uniref:PilZ domain-containing protein n=1 Tax=Pseudomonas sp. R5(2019) TaxID=2697566 RepID=UPI0014120A6F|nr:PilZ domain-containing protein [Pseudomonas sp. R5(2019)]NBA93697.1 PilZ domain-containing protein [Pseudomonas sp. R5(2019)]
MNRFLPHPFDVPVVLSPRKCSSLSRQRLHTISLGGVACNHYRAYRRGTAIDMAIPSLGEDTHYPGYVAWCYKLDEGYLIGIAFTDEQTLFGARMGEQVCQIKHYCEQHAQLDGSDDAAIAALAQEWVEHHAVEFSHASLSLIQEEAPPPLQL